MSVATNQTSYGLGGQKEQFDKLFAQGDRKTPVLDRIPGADPATAARVDWDVETIDAANPANFAVEGADYDYSGTNVTTKLFNYIAQSTKGWSMSLKATRLQYAGRKDELKRVQQLKALELRRDMEAMLLQTTAAPVQGNNSGPTASRLAGVPYFIINKGGVNIDNTSGTLLEADVREALAGIAANGGGANDNLILTCSFADADTVSDWASVTNSIVRIQKNGQTLDVRLLTYVGNSGSVTVVPTALGEDDYPLILDTSTWGISFLGEALMHIWKDKPDGKAGQASASAFRGTFETDWTLVAKNPTMNARIKITR
jgi:hypothetical protein